MGRAPRQLSQEREEMLLDVSRDVFLAKGVGNATIDQIAATAGISKATIYRRYSNKEEIFEAIITRAAKHIALEIGDFTLDTNDPIGSLTRAAWRIRKALVDNLEILRLQIAELPRHTEACQQSRERMNSILMNKLITFFEELVARSQMEHTHIWSAASTFVIMAMGGFRPFFLVLQDEEQERERMEADLAILIKGCGIRPPQPKTTKS